MRHTFARLMIDKGINLKTIAECLGHADLTMLMKVYGNKIMKKANHTNYLNLFKEFEAKNSFENQTVFVK